MAILKGRLLFLGTNSKRITNHSIGTLLDHIPVTLKIVVSLQQRRIFHIFNSENEADFNQSIISYDDS